MNPTTLTIIRYGVGYAMVWLASKVGIPGLASDDTINIVVTAVASLVAAGIAVWGVSRSTTAAKVQDLAANPDIHAIHASPEIVAAANSDKVKAP